jgi:acylphosphatase
MDTIKTVHAIISGRVQGVFFRAWTRQQALELGLVGWVRNLPSGQVEVMAQGADQVLAGFLELLHQGPPLAQVDRVDKNFLDDEQPMTGFIVRR